MSISFVTITHFIYIKRFNSFGRTKTKNLILHQTVAFFALRLVLPQLAQTHYRNAGVTLAYKRHCVTNGYLQRVVWDVNDFLKREKKCSVFFNKIGVPYCLVVFVVV